MSGSNRLSGLVNEDGNTKSLKTTFASPESESMKVKRKRKSLKPLQRSAQDENTLVGNSRNNENRVKKGKRKMADENSNTDSPRKIQRTIFSYMNSPLKIYEDPETDKSGNIVKKKEVKNKLKEFDEVDSPVKEEKKREPKNSEIDPEAYLLMVQDEVPEEYWKDLAEQRRIALNETLEENEKLHVENRSLKEENGALKDEVDGLKEMAGQAEYFANIVKLLTNEEDVDGCENAEEATEDGESILASGTTGEELVVASDSVSSNNESGIRR